MVHKEGPDTRYTTPVLILVIRLRLRSIAISRLFRLRCMGPTSRIWSCAPLHVSIWLYHRRHAPQIQAKLTMSSWRSPRSEPRRFAVIDQGPPRLIGNQHSQRATTARFQWPRATGSPSKGRVSFILVHFPEQRPPELVVPLGWKLLFGPARSSQSRMVRAESADAPAWPRFLPRRAHSTGGM